MYMYVDHFLSDTARITVDREDNGDVMIHVKDSNFTLVWFDTYEEAQKLVGKFDTLDYHFCWHFPGGVTLFDKFEHSQLKDLKFTLEMM